MHELAIAQDILAMIEREAIVHNAVQVKAIRLRMGTHSHLEKRSLSFCLEAIAQDTILDGARIDISTCHAEVECPVCGRLPLDGEGEGEVKCPKCGNPAKRMPPTEIYIQEIVLDVEDRSDGTESPE